MNTKDIFHISEDQAFDVDNFKETFKDKADLRATLEDYFHIYDDYAEMSEDDFDKAFEEYAGKESDNTDDEESTEVTSSAIGDIKYNFSLGKIKEDDAIAQLTKNGKGKREAKKILEKWKSNGIVKSSVDSVADEIADYFGTEAGEDNVVECDDIITHEDSEFIKDLLIDDEDVKAKIGLYTVRVEESPELTNAVHLSVEEDENNVVVGIEKPENDFEDEDGETSFVQINSEEDYDDYGVHLPEGYDFEDIKGMWWEIDSEDGVSMKEVIQQSGDDEVFIIIDNDRVFFDTAYNYIFDSDAEPEDYGFADEEFEEGKYVGE